MNLISASAKQSLIASATFAKKSGPVTSNVPLNSVRRLPNKAYPKRNG